MGVGQLSESDAVDALRLPFYSSSHPTGSHGWRNQFDLGNPDLVDFDEAIRLNPRFAEAYEHRGSLYASLGRPDLAARDLEEAERLRQQATGRTSTRP